MPEKFREKYRKNQRTGSFGKSLSGARGEPGVAQAATRRGPTPDRARGAPGALVHLWLPPSPIYSPSRETSEKENPFSRSLLSSAVAALPRSGAPEDLFPAPCRREEPPSRASPPPWMLPG